MDAFVNRSRMEGHAGRFRRLVSQLLLIAPLTLLVLRGVVAGRTRGGQPPAGTDWYLPREGVVLPTPPEVRDPADNSESKRRPNASESAVSPPSDQPDATRSPLRARARATAPGLVGLATIAALLGVRDAWAADLVLAAMVLTLPGLLALRAARVPARAITAFPLYVPAASLAVLMCGGLLADVVAPWLGVGRPLQGSSTAVGVLVVSLILWCTGLLAPVPSALPWRSLLGRPSLLAPLGIPALAAAGALLLDHRHGSAVAEIALVLAALALLGCMMAAGRLSPTHVGILLFSCALAAEWAFSLRSQEVIGFDITSEIHVAQHTQAVGVWRTNHTGDAYGAMLSLTVLPSVLRALTGIPAVLCFKVLYPIFTALLPVGVFMLAKGVMQRSWAAGAAALIIAQSYFFELLPQLARQEIGLLFFVALMAAVLDGRLQIRTRLALTAGLAAGTVLSHYSTAYVGVLVSVTGLVLATLGLRRASFRRGVAAGLATAAVVLAGGAALWYGTVTHSAENASSFIATLRSRGLNLLPQAKGGLLNGYLNGNAVSTVSPQEFSRLARQDYRGHTYIHPLPAAARPEFALQPASVPAPPVRSPVIADDLSALSVALAQLMLIMAGAGSLVMLLRRAGGPLGRAIGVLGLASAAVLTIIRFSGTVAMAYNQTRALSQCLILLAIPAAWLGARLTDRLGRARVLAGVLVALAVTFQFAFQSGLTSLALGGGTGLNVAQRGEDFERFYMTPAELSAAAWAGEASRGGSLYSDRYGQLRLWATSGQVALTELTPQTLDRSAWVYATRTNVILGRARGLVGNSFSLYRWPKAFLDTEFNAVYSDGDSRVYHGSGP